MFFRRRNAAADDAPDSAPASPPVSPLEREQQQDAAAQLAEVKVLQERLAGLVRQANADGARLPVGAVPTVREIDDVLRPLLAYVERQGASDEPFRFALAPAPGSFTENLPSREGSRNAAQNAERRTGRALALALGSGRCVDRGPWTV